VTGPPTLLTMAQKAEIRKILVRENLMWNFCSNY
jgi:hypothetical protein